MLNFLIPAAASLIGGAMKQNSENKQMDMQKEFAQNGIKWKVQDAVDAGIHPLAALGAQTHAYNPVQVGGMGDAVHAMGQNIDRAMNATRDTDERQQSLVDKTNTLQLENMELQNALLASQIRSINATGSPPPMPTSGLPRVIEGQANSPVQVLPQEVVTGDQGMAGGVNASREWYRLGNIYYPVIHKKLAESMEADPAALINYTFNSLVDRPSPPQITLPPNKQWEWSWRGGYYMKDIKKPAPTVTSARPRSW